MVIATVKRSIASIAAALILATGSVSFLTPLTKNAAALPASCTSGSAMYYALFSSPRYNYSYNLGQWCLVSQNAYSIFQSDGNLVTYVNGKAVWASNSGGKGATRIVFQWDGNVVIYRGSTPVWNTRTNGQAGTDSTKIEQFSNGALNIYRNDAVGAGHSGPVRSTQIW